MAARLIFRGLLVMVVLVLFAWLLKDVLDADWVDAQVRDRGIAGVLLFVLACCLLGSLGLSRQVIAFLGGYAFGFSQGLVLSMLAVVGACITTFYLARGLLRGWLLTRMPARIRRVDRFLHEHTFTMALLLRLLPLGSNWMINVAAGVSSVKKWPFFLGSALGYIPQMLIFSLLGSGTRVDQFWQVAIAMALFVLAAVLGVVLYRKAARGKTLGPELDRELGMGVSTVTQE
ncbi:MAG: VTT domain-containing protein [Gammaproteobacteria bacterium]